MNFNNELKKHENRVIKDLPTCEKCNIISKAKEIKDYCKETICLVKNPEVGNDECPFMKYDDEGLYCELTETESFPWDWEV